MTVRGLLAQIGADELAEWQAFSAMEPFGFWSDHYHAALIASTIANANRGKSQKAFQPADFMPFLERRQMPDADRMRQLKQMIQGAGEAAGRRRARRGDQPR
jgi:hypothetical protein